MTLFEDPAAKPVYQGRGEARGIKCDVWRQIRMNWPGNAQANTMWRWFFTQKKGEESQPVRPHVNVYTSVLSSRAPYISSFRSFSSLAASQCIDLYQCISVILPWISLTSAASQGIDLYQCITVILPWISRTPDISNLDCVPGRFLVSVYHCSFTLDILNPRGRRCGLVVSALDSGWRGQGSSPGRGHCVVFLGKTLYSHSTSLHPGVQMGTSKLSGKPGEMLGNYLRWTSIPSRRSSQYSYPLHATETGISSGSYASHARYLTFFCFVFCFFVFLFFCLFVCFFFVFVFCFCFVLFVFFISNPGYLELRPGVVGRPLVWTCVSVWLIVLRIYWNPGISRATDHLSSSFAT